jgi:hypothetical protein
MNLMITITTVSMCGNRKRRETRGEREEEREREKRRGEREYHCCQS